MKEPKPKVTNTAPVHEFNKNKKGVWYHTEIPGPIEHFIFFSHDSSSLVELKVKDSETKVKIALEDREEATIGYNPNTKTVYFDVQPEAFISGEAVFFQSLLENA